MTRLKKVFVMVTLFAFLAAIIPNYNSTYTTSSLPFIDAVNPE